MWSNAVFCADHIFIFSKRYTHVRVYSSKGSLAYLWELVKSFADFLSINILKCSFAFQFCTLKLHLKNMSDLFLSLRKICYAVNKEKEFCFVILFIKTKEPKNGSFTGMISCVLYVTSVTFFGGRKVACPDIPFSVTPSARKKTSFSSSVYRLIHHLFECFLLKRFSRKWNWVVLPCMCLISLIFGLLYVFRRNTVHALKRLAKRI